MINIEHIRVKYSVEVALLILSCRVYFKTAKKEELDAFIINQHINWELFFKLCRAQSVRPVAYKILIEQHISAELKERLNKELFTLTVKSWDLAKETERIILLFKARGIQLLPYKGAAFSKQFFGDLISRESSDIDLVINQKDVEVAVRIMEEEGYLGEDEVYKYLGNQYFKEYKDLCFNKYKEGKRLFHVEFHWAVAERYMGMGKVAGLIFKEGPKLNLVREPLVSIDAEAHFLTVMIGHVWRDSLKNFKAIVDLGIGIQANALIEPTSLNTKVKELRLQQGFNLSIALVDQLLGVKYTSANFVAPSQKMIDYFKSMLFKDDGSGKRIYIRGKVFFFSQMMLRDSLSDKIGFILGILRSCFYPTLLDFKVIKLYKPFFFLYFFIKPVRFFFKQTDAVEYKKGLVPVKDVN
jgi:hypothetical protein